MPCSPDPARRPCRRRARRTRRFAEYGTALRCSRVDQPKAAPRGVRGFGVTVESMAVRSACPRAVPAFAVCGRAGGAFVGPMRPAEAAEAAVAVKVLPLALRGRREIGNDFVLSPPNEVE